MLDPVSVPYIRPEVGQAIADAFAVAFIKRAAKYSPGLSFAKLGVKWLPGKQQLRVWFPPTEERLAGGFDEGAWVRIRRTAMTIHGFDRATTIREGSEALAEYLVGMHFRNEDSAMAALGDGMHVDDRPIEDDETVEDYE